MQTERVRLALTIQYDGTGYHGWQLQPDVRTVQGEVEAAVERLTTVRRPVLASGRTDAGVHASGQVASLDVPPRWTPAELRKAMNAVLPDDIRISRVRRVHRSFHARYHATARSYVYRLGITDASASPFRRRWCWPVRCRLDRELLEGAAELLTGEHSFRAFAKSGQEKRGDRCRVTEARWEPWDDVGLSFTITANRYLHHMVRYLMGTMVDIGRGRRAPGDLSALLDEEPIRGHLQTSPPAPPDGLFLARVEYPPEKETPDAPPPPGWREGGAADVDADDDPGQHDPTLAEESPLPTGRQPAR